MTEHSPELDKIAPALVTAMRCVKGAVRDSLNPHFKSRYADLESVREACWDALVSNEIAVVQLPGYEDTEAGGRVLLDTMLLHSSGQWIRATAKAPIGKPDAQGVGSALTYLRRYALAGAAGVVQTDDDGNAAAAPATEPAVRAARLPGDATKWDGYGGKLLPEVPTKTLTAAQGWLRKKDAVKNAALIGEIEAELNRRVMAAVDDESDLPDITPDALTTARNRLAGKRPDEMRALVKDAALCEKMGSKTLAAVVAGACSGLPLEQLEDVEDFAAAFVAIAKWAQTKQAEVLTS